MNFLIGFLAPIAMILVLALGFGILLLPLIIGKYVLGYYDPPLYLVGIWLVWICSIVGLCFHFSEEQK